MKLAKALKRFTAMLFVAILAFNLCGISASAAEKRLSVPAYNQAKSKWCWAAAGQAIVNYKKGTSHYQCTIYKEGKKYSACTTDEDGSIYTQFTNIFTFAKFSSTGTVVFSPTSWSTTVGQINLNRPILARIGWKSYNSGHFAVISGYNDGLTDYVYWTDIGLSGSTTRKSTYSAFKDNSEWTWTTSRYAMY
ncbi:hypothetical protein G3A_06715 [Bacillus sp. 17376]|uniref:Peptidase C39-like domain-containing protein n=1 Tax=Mesobacillus boroniphilus JCM 21738 TaxID=1294265 RepID=W4RKV1_9BACI|nr:C39 family peptidase [Mesobacillus boroniphilus]ESU33368.1 hypothetical protein G3A_06715 [Bacillus sp. 17376]GAE44782.1 hypothetical protein JCM21738_1522 [Mesobacillus boroniphilus JCM 21738]